MTIKINVSAFRCIKVAEVEVSPIALIAGNNGNGKTSLAQAAAAAFTGQHAPGLNIAKKDASALIHRGSERVSAAKVSTAEGSAMMTWPKCDFSTNGTPPEISKIAAGIIRLSAMDAKERALVLNDYLKTEPTEEELKKALGVALEKFDGDHTKRIDNIVAKLKEIGWDATEKLAADTATKAKGAWEQVTKQKYGSAKAESWLPDGFDEFSFQNVDAATLAEGLAELRGQRDKAIAARAVLNADLSAYETEAAKIDDLTDAGKTLARYVDEAKAAVTAFEGEEVPPKPVTSDTVPLECPDCGRKLVLQNGKLVVFATEGLTPEHQVASMNLAITNHTKRGQELATALRNAENAVRDNDLAISASQLAQTKLDEAKAKAAGVQEEGDPDDLAASIERNQTLLVAMESAAAAKEHATNVTMYLALKAVLAADGLRQTKMLEALAGVNEQLDHMSKVAGWPEVSIAQDLSLRYGGHPYEVLSESEKYRVNVTLQLRLADIDGSQAVIIDAADILDAKGKQGLFALLEAAQEPRFGRDTPMSALVCMTASKVEQIPNLAEIGLGKTYWVEAGTVKEV
jgi:hypothetical protein